MNLFQVTAVLLFLSLSLSSPASGGHAEGTHPLTVVTYNIKVGIGLDRAKNREEVLQNLGNIAGFLEDEDADVVLLQEVDKNTRRTYEIDETAWLGEELSFEHVFAPAIEMNSGGEYGLAILSRWPILSSEKAELYKPDYSGVAGVPEYYSEQRILLAADIQTTAGMIRVLNTHLGLTQDQREHQIDEISHIVRNAEDGVGVILGGDLNAEPDAEELIPIRLLLRDCYHGFADENGFLRNMSIRERLTFRADDPVRCIDYLYVTSGQFQVISTRVPEVTWSDHLPVVSNLVIISPNRAE